MKSIRTSRHQYGALPVRTGDDNRLEVLLITSRETGRWIIPKGWPIRGRSPSEAATIEACEEAGIKGRIVGETRVGSYRYRKMQTSGSESELKVYVFLFAVDQELDDWPERTQRRREWFKPEKAAALVAEPQLARMIARVRRSVKRSRKPRSGA